MHYVIFSIDKAYDLHTKAKFLRHIDTQRAMNYLNGNVMLCIWCYEGVLGDSFILRSDDFDKWVRNSGYVDNQKSVLHVRGKDMHCEFEYLQGGCYGAGKLVPSLAQEALKSDGWVYRPDLNIYWILEEN